MNELASTLDFILTLSIIWPITLNDKQYVGLGCPRDSRMQSVLDLLLLL